eukprot:COSAG04_NODE_924_length_9380_cov_8.463312_3_plen_246_part_00
MAGAHHPAGHAGGHLGRDRLFSRLARRYPPSTPFFGGQLLPAPLPTRSSCPLTPHAPAFCACSGGTVSSAVPYAEAYQHTSADVILFEIEDSVPALDKDRVRSHLVDVVGRGNFAPHQRRMVTINRLDTPWGRDDLVAMAQAAVHGVVLAKCESPDEVRAASEILDAAGAPPDLEIWAMIETARGLLAVEEIAAARGSSGGRLSGINVGLGATPAPVPPCRFPAACGGGDRVSVLPAVQATSPAL